jgi:hypothetical protein
MYELRRKTFYATYSDNPKFSTVREAKAVADREWRRDVTLAEVVDDNTGRVVSFRRALDGWVDPYHAD